MYPQIKTLTLAFTCLVGGCSTNPHPSQQEKPYSANKEKIAETKNSFSCDMQEHRTEVNFINAYIRESNIYRTNPFDATSERVALKQGIEATVKYINPEFFSEFHTTPENSIILDRFIEYLRPPELICIKNTGPNKHHAYIFSYSARTNTHASIDRIDFISKNNKKYITPQSPPEPIESNLKQIYAETGSNHVPTSGIRVLAKVFKDDTTKKAHAETE